MSTHSRQTTKCAGKRGKARESAGKRGKARESTGDQVMTGFRLAYDWFRAWREFFFLKNNYRPKQSKTNQIQINFDNQLEIILTCPIRKHTNSNWAKIKWQKYLRQMKIISLQNHTICTLVIFRVGGIRWKTRRWRPLVFLFGRWFLLGGAHLWKKILKKAINGNIYLSKYGGRTGE